MLKRSAYLNCSQSIQSDTYTVHYSNVNYTSQADRNRMEIPDMEIICLEFHGEPTQPILSAQTCITMSAV